MNSSTQSIATILGIVTVLFGGYYLYANYMGESVSFSGDEQTLQNMLASTEVFIARRQELSRIELDTSLFEDSRFNTLVSFSTAIEPRPVGRVNPFEPVTTTP